MATGPNGGSSAPATVLYLDDLRVGQRFTSGERAVDADRIKSFAAEFDPQPFHLDEEAAARSHFGALCASGWHTASMWMRVMVDYDQRESAAARARGEMVARLGPSPGFRELKWLKPVYAGDTIAFVSEVIETRPLASRPQWGMVRMRTTGTNQKGERVYEIENAAFIERRAA